MKDRPSFGDLFQVGLDILGTVVDATTNTVLVQLGFVVDELPFSNHGEWWQHVGFVSRPPKANKGKAAAQGIALRRTEGDVCFASRDTRSQAIYGALDNGETCLYAAGEDGNAQGRVIIKKTGAVTMYSKAGNTANGSGMLIQVDPTTDTVRALNGQGFGIIADDNGVTITSGNASIVLTAGGDISIVAKGNAQMDGAGVVIGSLVAPGVNSAITGPTGIAGKASLKVLIE